MVAVPGTKVFITHSSQDGWIALQLYQRIRSCGVEAFLDKNDVEHGDDFESRIRNEADSSSEQLVLLTPWAMDRPYVWLEVGHFWWTEKRIVVVLNGLTRDDFVRDERVPVYLKRLNVLDINDIESYFGQLTERAAAEATDDQKV